MSVDALDYSAAPRAINVDVRELTKAFKVCDIGSVVPFTDGAQGSVMAVKIGTAFVDVAFVKGEHGVTASGLMAEGMLLA